MALKDEKTIIKLKAVTQKTSKLKHGFARFFGSIGGYFKGAWRELRQVRWPDRKSSWGLTLAVILFTGFFVLLIVLLDIGFKQLFELILK